MHQPYVSAQTTLQRLLNLEMPCCGFALLNAQIRRIESK